MPTPLRIAPLAATAPFDGGPTTVAERWPRERPLLLLGSGRPHPRWSRWSIFAAPEQWLVVRSGDTGDPLARFEAALRGTRRPGTLDLNEDSTTAEQIAAAELPFLGGWIGLFSYELGRTIEPVVGAAGPGARPAVGPEWPLVAFAHCPRALVHDSARNRWWSVGPADQAPLETTLGPRAPREAWALEALRQAVDPAEWQRSVARTVEYIRAGDIYQANIAHLLRTAVHGSRRGLGLAALDSAQPWHGALLELPDGATVVSLSPELFLAGELPAALSGTHPGAVPGAGGGFVVSRPIKGTRPESADPDDLYASAKDEAELTMIVDLMRNDLGRVCRPGTVQVSEPRHVERHPTVHQGVATVEGRLRDDIDAAALLRATFPPGSVTGAPKIRAMQVIEQEEPHARGPYCGAIGFFSDHGRFGLNVAIRTLAFAPPGAGGAAPDVARGFYGVGCGIVADSDPAEEWRESLDKAAVVAAIARADAADAQGGAS